MASVDSEQLSSSEGEIMANSIPLPGFLLSLVLALGSVLMLLFIGEKSLWIDEVLSVAYASNDWKGLWRLVSGEQANMGLYYVLLHYWLSLGETEFVVRSLSVAFALASVPFVYTLGARLFGQQEGIIAALLLAVNAFFVRYAQEARGYTLAVLLVSVSSYFFVRALQQPSKKNWAGYIAASVLAVYSHFFAVLVLITHVISLIFLRPQDIRWKSLIISELLTVFMLSPLGFFVIVRDSGQLDWLREPGLTNLYGLFSALSGDGGAMLVATYFAICSIACFWGLRTWYRSGASFETWRFGFLLIWLVVPVLITFLFSFVKPVFQYRYLLISLPPLCVLAAAGLSRIQHRLLFAAVLLCIIGLSASGLGKWYVIAQKQNWRQATSFVLSRARRGDAIIFHVYPGKVAFEYYIERLNLKKEGVSVLEISSGPWMPGNRQPEPSQLVLKDIPVQYSRVWLVLCRDEFPLGHPLRRSEQRELIRDSLLRHYELMQNIFFHPGITIQLYEKLKQEKPREMKKSGLDFQQRLGFA